MTLVERIKELCDKNGETLASLEKMLHFGNATIRKWDNATPSGDRLAKVADHFHVSIDYLLGRQDENKTLGLSGIYLSLAKTAQDLELNPHDVDLIIRTVKEIKKHEKDDAE